MTRVVIDCRIEPGRFGGIEQAMQGIVAALARSPHADLEVKVAVWQGFDAWMRPHANGSGNVALVLCEPPRSRRVAAALRGSSLGRRSLDLTESWRSKSRGVPSSDGVLESLEGDLVHFPHQGAVLTAARSIYEPWDLQHLHLPEMFSSAEHERRERWYRAFCGQAERIVVHANQVSEDLVTHYGVAQERIAVVPMGSSLLLEPALAPNEGAARRNALGVPARFALYPAQSWPHKNHERLIDAVAQLRRHGLDTAVVCAGASHNVERLVAYAGRAGVADLVDFPGRLDTRDVMALYDGASCLVFPSLHEGFGLPVVEAFGAGVPVICSDISSLAELAVDAACFCDPREVESIAHALQRVWLDDDLVCELRAKGRSRARRYTWDAVAAAYVALYAQVTSQVGVR